MTGSSYLTKPENMEKWKKNIEKRNNYHYYSKYTYNPIKDTASTCFMTTYDVDYYHEQGVHNVVKVKYHNNPHIDFANFRELWKWRNVNQFCYYNPNTAQFDKSIIDVQVSQRDIKSGMAGVGLYVNYETQDYIRHSSLYTAQHSVIYDKESGNTKPISNMYLVNAELDEYFEGKTWDNKIINFTDSIYRYSNDKLCKIFSKAPLGVVGFGSMSIPYPRSDGELRWADKKIGTMHFNDEGKMEIKVDGNPFKYVDEVKFPLLLKYEYISLTDGETCLRIVAMDRVDFSAIQYVRFAIIRMPRDNKEDLLGPLSTFSSPDHISKNRCLKGFDRKIVADKIEKVNFNGKTQIVNFKTKTVKLDTPCAPTDEFYQMSETQITDADSLIQFVRINDEIRAATVRIDKTTKNIFQAIKNHRTQLELGSIQADFSIDMKTYNALIKNVLIAKQITKQTILECINLAEVRTNGLDYEKYLIPLTTSVLKKAFYTESRLSELLGSKLVKALNEVKMNGVKKVTLFDRFIAFVFGKVTLDSFQ
jgi:hypothetical protein